MTASNPRTLKLINNIKKSGVAPKGTSMAKASASEAYKVGQTVKPTKGPHAGQDHEVIHVHGDGSYNIKPKNMPASRIRYRLGAARAKHDELKEDRPGLWANIHKKRREGRPMRKKGEKGAPSPEAMARAKAASEDVTTANIPNPADTAMGPRYKTSRVYDRRKKKGTPKLLKRFADYYKDKGIG